MGTCWRYGGFVKGGELIIFMGSGAEKIEFHFYYRCAIKNAISLFKMWSEHVSKTMFQTEVFEQLFSNNPILNTITKHIVSNFGH